MNRRSFLGKLGAAVAGFAILPPATTYSRIWKAERPIVVPYWIQVKRVTVCYDENYLKGCSLTHAYIQALTPADFESMIAGRFARIGIHPSQLTGVGDYSVS